MNRPFGWRQHEINPGGRDVVFFTQRGIHRSHQVRGQASLENAIAEVAEYPLLILDFGPIEVRFPGECAPRWAGAGFQTSRVLQMAKAVTIKVKLVSSADTGFYYVAKKNSRTMTDKLVKKKYDPVARKHVEFRESKIK
jgi:large subunit ribosomal protein L33